MPFSKKTFQYFDAAKRNRKNKAWFEKNRANYEENVKAPFGALLEVLEFKLARHLPGISISVRKVTRPLRPEGRADAAGGIVKTHSHVTLWEKKTSLFEWNPGIHIQIGAEKDDNLVGLGLYMTSSRQMRLLRENLVSDFKNIDKILTDKKLRRFWGNLDGDRFKRFPKGFDPEHPSAKYLWHKQFFLNQDLTRAQVTSRKFAQDLSRDLEVAMPFFQWVRETVGTFKKTSTRTRREPELRDTL